MLGYISIILIVDNDFNVEGSSKGEGENYELNLPYDYAWSEILDNLTYVVHNDSIWGEGDEVIRKGRSFGTPGDAWTANYIRDELENLGLSNVQLLKLGPINNTDYYKWEYTSKVETIDFNLTCNSQDWDFTDDGHIPKNETFAMPSGEKNNSNPDSEYWTMSYNNTFNNAKLVPKNYTEYWSIIGASPSDYLNITNITILNELINVCGLAKYIPINQTLPILQIGRVFLLEEENGCESQLDNITNANTAILIHDNTQGGSNYYTNFNFSNLSAQCIRINRTENNMTTVI